MPRRSDRARAIEALLCLKQRRLSEVLLPLHPPQHPFHRSSGCTPVGELKEAAIGCFWAWTNGFFAITLLERHESELYPRLDAIGAEVAAALEDGARGHGLPLTVNRFGAAAHGFISETEIVTFGEAEATDIEMYRSFVGGMLAEGGSHDSARPALCLDGARGGGRRADAAGGAQCREAGSREACRHKRLNARGLDG